MRPFQNLPTTAHRLSTPRDCHVGFTKPKELRGRNDRLQTGATDAINAECRRLPRKTRANGRYTGQMCIPGLGRNDVSQNNVVNA